MSPLLIVYQVARGRAITRTAVRFSQVATPNIDGEMDRSNLKSIQFYHPTIGTFEKDITEVSELDCYTKPESGDGTQSSYIYDRPLPISPV